jgi:hypothetical protein
MIAAPCASETVLNDRNPCRILDRGKSSGLGRIPCPSHLLKWRQPLSRCHRDHGCAGALARRQRRCDLAGDGSSLNLLVAALITALNINGSPRWRHSGPRLTSAGVSRSEDRSDHEPPEAKNAARDLTDPRSCHRAKRGAASGTQSAEGGVDKREPRTLAVHSDTIPDSRRFRRKYQ